MAPQNCTPANNCTLTGKQNTRISCPTGCSGVTFSFTSELGTNINITADLTASNFTITATGGSYGDAPPTLSGFTFGGTVAYNPGSTTATSIDVAANGSPTESPTGYYIGDSGTSTTGSSANGGEVSIDAAGLASYKPAANFRGSDSFVVRAFNGGGTSNGATVSLTVGDPTLLISLTGSDAVLNSPVSGYSVSVSGGKAPYNCTAKSLPAGLTLNANCTITGTPNETGSFTFTADVSDSSTGSGSFSATSQTLTLNVGTANQATLSITGGTSVKVQETLQLGTSGGSGTGALTWAVENTAICSISDSGLLTGITTGTCAVTVAKAADANYLEASASANITVSRGSQSALVIAATPSAIAVNETTTLSTTGGEGTGAVAFSLQSGPCTLAGNKLTADNLGVCTISATKAQDTNYEAQTAELVIDIDSQINPVMTENDLLPVLAAQLMTNAWLSATQSGNVVQRLTGLRSGVRKSGFSAQGFALRQDDGNELAWLQESVDHRKADRMAFGHATEVLEAKETETTLALADDTQAPAELASEPLFSGWINGTVTYGRQNNDDGSDGHTRDGFSTAGVTLGADFAAADDLILGAAFGYGEAQADIGKAGSSVDSRILSAMFYGNLDMGKNNYIDLLAGYGAGHLEPSRWSTGGATLLTGERDADQFFAILRLSHEMTTDAGLTVVPSLSFEALRMKLGTYSEDGADAWELAYDEMSVTSFAAVPGLRADWQQRKSWGTLTPTARFEFRHAFEGSFRQSFAYSTISGGASYAVEEDSAAKSSILLGLGFTVASRDGWTMELGYDFTSDVSGKDDLISHSLSATYSQEF